MLAIAKLFTLSLAIAKLAVAKLLQIAKEKL